MSEKVLKLNGRKAYWGKPGATTWDELEGKPFGEESVSYGPPVADDSIDHFDCFGATYYKVSDDLPTPDELNNYFTYTPDGTITMNGASVGKSGYSDDTVFHDTMAGYIVVCYDTTITPNGGDAITVPSKGVYMNPNYQWVIKSETTKTLDPKWLPSAAAVADVTAAPTADEFNALLASLRAAGYLAE